MHKARLLPPFALQLRPSRHGCGWCWQAVRLHYPVADLPAAMVAMLPCQCVLAWYALRANGWWNPHGVKRIEVDGLGRMRWHLGSVETEVVLRDDCFVSPCLLSST
jgi:hypothetical protein